MRDHHYHPKSCPWKEAPKKCSASGNQKDYILIDDDNIIITDFPKSLNRKLKNSAVSRDVPFVEIISIDDDNDTDNLQPPGGCVEGTGGENVDSDASTKSNRSQGSTVLDDDDDDDECQVIQEKSTLFRFSKFKQTSKRATSRNRFGISSESENDLSGSDCSDCEVLEGSVGELRERWEKAFPKKRYYARTAGSHLHEEAGPSKPQYDINQGAGVENLTEQNDETQFGFASTSSDSGKENFSTFFGTGRGSCHVNSFNPSMKSSRAGPSESCEGGGASGLKQSSDSGKENFSTFFGTGRGSCHVNSFNPSMKSSRAGPSESCEGGGDSGLKQSSTMRSEEPNVHADVFCSTKNQRFEGELSNPCEDVYAHHHLNSDMRCEDNSFNKTVQPDAGVNDKGSSLSPVDNENNLEKAACQTNFKESEKQDFLETLSSGRRKLSEDGEEKGMDPFKNMPGSDLEAPIADPTESTSRNVQCVAERDIINDREKLKETDEYKKAAEVEWESRQQQLRIQAEEAQRLRKRKKLETMRQLDMERRQKLRVEEIREAQKKDEENMNLKEQRRVEVMKNLKFLELTCTDMASLLRGLGIQVEGGPYPSAHEVHAAYKRAVLKFHPDRASGADIFRQVEAEEKFKLISRMKDKLLFAPRSR